MHWAYAYMKDITKFCPPKWYRYVKICVLAHGLSPTLRQALCIISNPSVNSNWSYSPEMLNSGQNWWFFVPCDLEIWRITLKNNRAPLLCHIKLHASFHLNKWIQITVMVRKRLNWVLTSVTLTLDIWPRAFDWTSLLSMVITPGNFIMIRWLPGASWWDRRHPTEHMT